MINFKQLTLASVCALTFGLGTQLAMAQGAEQAAPDAQPSAPAAAQTLNVSDSHLALYAKAATKVETIRQSVQQQMPEADTPEQAHALQEEAMEEMVSAVESYGMTVDEYNQIATAVQQDPDLQARLEELL